jgi:hypothetical protein
MAQTTTESKTAEFLKAHPRTIGALFTICVLLMQAGNVMANAGSTNAGP